MKRLTYKQVKYLWAVGVFKGKGQKKATEAQITAALNNIGKKVQAPEPQPKSKVQALINAPKQPKPTIETPMIDSKKGASTATKPKVEAPKPEAPKTRIEALQSKHVVKTDMSKMDAASLQKYTDKKLTTTNHLGEVTREAFDDYQGEAYVRVNAIARGHKTDPRSGEEYDQHDRDESDRILAYLNTAIKKAKPIPEPLEVHRGVIGKLGSQLLDLHNKGNLIGSEISDKAVMSTSFSPTTAGVFRSGSGQAVHMSITLPKGTRGVYFATGHEQEFLLGSNSKLKVMSSEVDDRGILRLQMELQK